MEAGKTHSGYQFVDILATAKPTTRYVICICNSLKGFYV